VGSLTPYAGNYEPQGISDCQQKGPQIFGNHFFQISTRRLSFEPSLNSGHPQDLHSASGEIWSMWISMVNRKQYYEARFNPEDLFSRDFFNFFFPGGEGGGPPGGGVFFPVSGKSIEEAQGLSKSCCPILSRTFRFKPKYFLQVT